jgi:hypothetical protein
MNLLIKIRQRLCRHQWKLSRFQALVPGRSVTCVKCGKHEQTCDAIRVIKEG